MKQKDIELFDKTIHDLKRLLSDISKERENKNTEIDKLLSKMKTIKAEHDNRIKKLIKKVLNLLTEVNELYLDLSEENGGTK